MLSQSDLAVIEMTARRLVDVVHQSIDIASTSKNVETRRSRLRVATQKLDELAIMAGKFPALKIANFADVQKRIMELHLETDSMPDPRRKPVEKAPHVRVSSNVSIYKGCKFHAEPSFKTPLRILKRHGERSEADDEAVAYGHGSWRQEVKSFSELGFRKANGDEIIEPRPTVASEIGAIDPDKFIAFLIAIKEASIGEGDIDERAMAVNDVASLPQFSAYVDALGGIRKLIDRVFPRVLDLMTFLPDLLRDDMRRLKLDTVAAIDALPDLEILAMPGMGPSRLRRLRNWCSQFAGDRDFDRADPRVAASMNDEDW